jgi:hypothetical protein
MLSLILRRPKQKKKKDRTTPVFVKVNYYRDMWFCRSELLAPLNSFTSSKVKFEWRSSHQHAFDKIKKVIETEIQVLLCYPDFKKQVSFHIYIDADHQLGAVIMQDKQQKQL